MASSTSTTPGHVPTTHQMPEVAQQPQLPPATPQNDNIEETEVDKTIPTPKLASTESTTQTQKSPTLAQPEIATENVNEKLQPSE